MASAVDDVPLDDEAFAALMAPLAPFETAPRLAVAVSGGADSLALCLLSHRWAQARGGEVVGLTVDHGLRPEAAAEAAQVAGWLAAHGIRHVILRWEGEKPSTGLQAAAREARYGLLRQWCREAGILHLLLAHHRDDQAETFLLRLGRGSGVDGLAAMAPITATLELRLLRPLLDVSHARLTATLAAWGQEWIEDPSNANPAFGRVRLRRLIPDLAAEDLTPTRLAQTAHRLQRARQALDLATADLLVRSVCLHAEGFARLDPAILAAAPEEVGLRCLARLCRTIGGANYPPRLERLERLYGQVHDGLLGRRTFAGCVLAPGPRGVVVCREPAAVAGPQTARAGQTVVWDGRFSVRLSGCGEARVAALGAAGWLAIRDHIGVRRLPATVVATLPAVVDRHGISAVPHLGYEREMPAAVRVERIAFTPAWPLAGAGPA